MSDGAGKYRRLLDEAIENLSQYFFDSYGHDNAEFRTRSGLPMIVIREELGDCCSWCADLAGTYDYADAPKEVWQRHANCRCMVITRTERGTYQDAWSRKEYQSEREARIARAQEIIKENKNEPWTNKEKENKISAKERNKSSDIRIRKPPGENVTEGPVVRVSVGAKLTDGFEATNPFTGELIQLVPGAKRYIPKDHLIAGKGSKSPIKYKMEELLEIGGTREGWKHEKAYFVAYDDFGEEAYVELHWFECEGVPGKVDVIPRVRGGELFFDDIEKWERKWRQ